MARLVTHRVESAMDPLAETVALLDLVDGGDFDILVAPPSEQSRRRQPAKLDRSPDAYVWFWREDPA